MIFMLFCSARSSIAAHCHVSMRASMSVGYDENQPAENNGILDDNDNMAK